MLWKTMPGRVKQVPQDSTEWNWMDTVHSTDKHLRVWSRYKLLFWTPLVISCKKYIYWKLFIFIRVWLTSSILVTPDFEHTVKRYPVSGFSWTLNISDSSEHHDRPDFWTEDPDLWFLHAEAASRNVQITQSKTKSYRNFPRRLWSWYGAWSWVLRPPQKPLTRI